MQEKVSIMGVWCGQKNLSLGITVRHHSASLVMPISDPRDRFFYPHHTHMIDTYIIPPLPDIANLSTKYFILSMVNSDESGVKVLYHSLSALPGDNLLSKTRPLSSCIGGQQTAV